MCSTPRITFCRLSSPSRTITRLAMFLARSPIRSRSLETRSAPTMSRRSIAIGWRRAMVRIAFSSISRCRRSILESSTMTLCDRSASCRLSASIAWPISRSARPPISAIMRDSSWRSASNALWVCSVIAISSLRLLASAEAAGDVVLGAPVRGRGEHLARGVELDQLAEIHEGGIIRDARRLLHVVGHDGDGVIVLELVDQLLDLGGGDRVERRAGLVEQDHFWLDHHGAGDAQALLLAAGEAEAVSVQLVLDLAPDRGPMQRQFDPLVELGARDLLVERHRKRRRLLEHHADARPQQVEVLARLQDVAAVQQHLALRPLMGIEVVDAIEDAQQRRFSTAGRPDEGHHPAVIERHVDGFERPMVAIVEIQIPDRHFFRGPAVRVDILAGHRYRRRCVGAGGVHGIHDAFLELASARAVMLSASTAKVMMSAPIQASLCQSA